MNRTIISVRDMTIRHSRKVLYGRLDIDINEGDCIMLCGANGSGKTTFLKSLAASSEEIAMIPARIIKVKGFTLREFIHLSCFKSGGIGGMISDKEDQAIDNALETFSLSHLASRDISTLSDGEFQKGAIAAALARQSRIILLDEPTAFLDAENRKSVLKAIRGICDKASGMKERTAVIFSTHDLHDGLEVANRVMALGADGEIHLGSADEGNMEAAVKRIFSSEC
jgi:iron complex transport system ATP-binding protein